MVKVLTGSEVSEILEECRANGEVADYTEGAEQFFELPSLLGHGYWRKIQLSHGIHLSMTDYEKHKVHIDRIQQHSSTMPLTLTYYLSGGCSVDNDGIKSPFDETAGKSYLYCLPNTAETERYESGQRLRRVRIQITPELMSTFGEQLHDLPADVRQTIERPGKSIFHHSSKITPQQRQILQQLYRCPFRGITRQIYLEAKVLELVALHIDQLAASGQPSHQLPANDIDRIYQAREILIRDMAQPPSLSELARHVQLNERKLKQGFRQAFGTTVFGYLYNHRMQQARELLEMGQLSIQEIAWCVGYASRSSFVAAFKKKFQTPPSLFQKSG
ncbi:MAG: AraC family transcriptional regulator [Cyanobacteria bacterium P01_F01_bin.42]